MFRYVNDISELAQDILKRYSFNFDTAVDCTLGNGHDCDFLRENFNKVYAFDVQKEAVDRYNDKNHLNVNCICDSHANIKEHVKESVDAIMFNLGYLPGGDKSVTTRKDSTMTALKGALEILKPGGIMTVAVYHGHEEGKEEKEEILAYMEKLSAKRYGVMFHSYFNRSKYAPLLIVVEKKQEIVESSIN